ncbi:MAG: carbohydrate kinase family protein [Nitrososphaeraceae archaeon]
MVLLNSENILKKIKQCSEEKYFVIMYDFFIDRIVTLKTNDFMDIVEKTRYGGGSIRNIPTKEVVGGNAINLAYCLAKMEQRVVLFTLADEFGITLLKRLFKDFGDKVELRIVNGRPGFTTSLEFKNKNGKIESNVMISDVGDNRTFGPENFTNQDIDVIKNSYAIIIVNWASNIKGTELVEFAFKNSRNSFHFLDPADIKDRINEFCNDIIKLNNLIDILSINENECNAILSEIGNDRNLLGRKYFSKDVKDAAKIIAEKFNIDIIIHTKKGSAWSNGLKTIFKSSDKNINVKTLTGAGDSWNAAYILGQTICLTKHENLLFANKLASMYISIKNRQEITLPKLIEKYLN